MNLILFPLPSIISCVITQCTSNCVWFTRRTGFSLLPLTNVYEMIVTCHRNETTLRCRPSRFSDASAHCKAITTGGHCEASVTLAVCLTMSVTDAHRSPLCICITNTNSRKNVIPIISVVIAQQTTHRLPCPIETDHTYESYDTTMINTKPMRTWYGTVALLMLVFAIADASKVHQCQGELIVFCVGAAPCWCVRFWNIIYTQHHPQQLRNLRRQQRSRFVRHRSRGHQLSVGHMQTEASHHRRHQPQVHARAQHQGAHDNGVRQCARPAAAVHRSRRHQRLWQAVRRGRHHARGVSAQGGHAVRLQEFISRAGGVPETKAGGALGADVAQPGCGLLWVAGEYCLKKSGNYHLIKYFLSTLW